MTSKVVELVMTAIKKAEIPGLEADGLKEIQEAVGSVSLKSAGLVEVGEDETVVKQSKFDELHADRRTLRKRAQAAEEERDQLKEAAESGDSHHVKLAEQYKKTLDEQKPLVEKLLKQSRERWERNAKSLPEANEKDEKVTTLRSKFHFPEEGSELSDDQVLANLDKYAELKELGVIEAKEAGTNAPSNPTGGGGGPTATDEDKAWSDFYAKPTQAAPGATGNAR